MLNKYEVATYDVETDEMELNEETPEAAAQELFRQILVEHGIQDGARVIDKTTGERYYFEFVTTVRLIASTEERVK